MALAQSGGEAARFDAVRHPSQSTSERRPSIYVFQPFQCFLSNIFERSAVDALNPLYEAKSQCKTKKTKQTTIGEQMQNEMKLYKDRKGFARSGPKLGLALMASCLASGPAMRADMVTDWNANTEQALLATNQGPPVRARSLAIVHTAIYDAVNGIHPKYTPYFVTERGPRGASEEAAAAQAA